MNFNLDTVYMSGFMKTLSKLNKVFFGIFVYFVRLFIYLFFAFATTAACNSYLA